MTRFLFFTIFLASAAFAECGAPTRTTIDTLRCHDLASNDWYELRVNEMCGTLSGNEQSVIEIEDSRPNLKQVQARIWSSEMESKIWNNKSNEWQLFEQRVGKSGNMAAYAIPARDGKRVEAVRLTFHPNGGEDCQKVVALDQEFWGKRW